MKIAIFGLGSIGRRHMQNLLDMGEADLFVYDPRISEGNFSCAPVQGTNSLDLIWQWQPEAVLICAPPLEHFSLALQALDHGAHVFIEKPISHTLKQAEIFKAATGAFPDLKVAIGYQLRWQMDEVHPGNLVFESSQDMSQWPSRYDKDVLLEFSHEIDAMVCINGPVLRVVASERYWGWTITMQHIQHFSEIYINHRSKAYVRKISSKSDVRWEYVPQHNDDAYKEELQTFLRVCNGEPWCDQLCTVAQATHVMKIIDACRQSAKNTEVVTL